MKTILFIITIALSTTLTTFVNPGKLTKNELAPVQAPTTYYFIRHAEKDTSDPTNKDPELAAAGVERAGRWVEVFKDVSFDHIYSTDYNRTRSTARRIADSQDKEVQFYNPAKLNDDSFKNNTKGKTILIVGHSNTNPAFANSILEEKRFKDIPETESGSLIIVTVFPDGTKHSQVLYIN